MLFFCTKTQRINIPGASWQDCRPQAGDGDQGSIPGHEGQRHCQTQGEQRQGFSQKIESANPAQLS